MASDIESTPHQEIQGRAQDGGLTATQVSRRLQEIGQGMLLAPELLEVDENVLSTCSEPIESFGDRLIRARDTGVPLVEVLTFPESGDLDALRKLFDVSGRVVLAVLRSDGTERHHRYFGNYLEYESVGLVIPTMHVIALDGDYGSEVSSVLTTGTYRDYDRTGNRVGWRRQQPTFSGSNSYETDDCSPESGQMGMLTVLNRSLEDFKVAVSRDGAIDVDAVEQVPGRRQLTADGS